jgi:ferredoxin
LGREQSRGKLAAKALHRGNCQAARHPEGVPMSCEHLICASCAAPVVEGRCPACRAARDHVHHQHWSVSPQLIVAAAAGVLLVLLLLSLHLAG